MSDGFLQRYAPLCELACFLPIGNGSSRHPSLGIVMGQEFGLGVRFGWKAHSDGFGDLHVQALTFALEQRVVSGILD